MGTVVIHLRKPSRLNYFFSVRAWRRRNHLKRNNCGALCRMWVKETIEQDLESKDVLFHCSLPKSDRAFPCCRAAFRSSSTSRNSTAKMERACTFVTALNYGCSRKVLMVRMTSWKTISKVKVFKHF